MPISTFLGLNIGVNALETAAQTENVIANNIANANTPGYAVENALIQESSPFPADNESLPVGQLGQGSQVSQIQRQTNPYLVQQDRANQADLQMYQSHQTVLTQIQGILNEPSSDSLQNSVDQFFQAWQTLSTDPTNTAARQAVIEQAKTVAQTFQTVTQQLEDVQSGLAGTIEGQVNQLITDAQNVAQLNAQIAMQTAIGQSPNTLLDQRSVYLDDMSKLAGVNIQYQENGTVTVSIGSGSNAVPLVGGANGSEYNANQDLQPSQLQSYQNAPSGGTSSYLPSSGYTSSGNASPASNNLITLLQSGSILGNAQGLDDVNKTLANLNSFLDTFATAVNNQQSSGLDLNNSAGPSIFVAPAGATTDSSGQPVDSQGNVVLDVNPSLTTNDIAAGSSSDGADGNSNANAMVALSTSTNTYSSWTYAGVVSDATQSGTASSGTFDQTLAALVSGVGVEAQGVQAGYNTANALAEQSSNLRQSVSGVDMNAQAAEMVQFQNSYNAAAKYISIFNQMLQTLIQNVG
ncbi:flagellar hook-associated protein FlgK [Alicyclobacillus sp. TC]|uniref:flagellar hook-associated protein FlgK n=1 Tax=Alicyclobacillus sp. TC TaxID=2606450 RepID=UPI0019335BF2|nr:flagellar hook-associated protein FlgK [Alicyclobacillus sp. TC]QRF22633.1 flagellar hook-associated protein FlgK [Alicyclobacillus sp. TC]